MASNFFGQIFRITTFGESHGQKMGVVIDGCPAGLSLSEQDINEELAWRKPGRNIYTTARMEDDTAEIISGVFEGKTTGAPIAILICNRDAQSSQYEEIKDLYRPGHANFTYLQKYKIFDDRGGGRASARETALRVAAGAVAKKLLKIFHIECVSFLLEVGGIAIQNLDFPDLQKIRKKIYASPIFCFDEIAEKKIMEKIIQIKEEKDSIGGIVASFVRAPVGLGDPVYCKLDAMLAFAMLSIPAAKGFEIGKGFSASSMRGSEHNDAFDIDQQGKVYTSTNCAGGVLGGISTGSDIFFKVAFKPPSSIQKLQQTVNLKGEKTTMKLPLTARHDPCVAIRAVPVVEAMTAIVLADALLMNRSSQV